MIAPVVDELATELLVRILRSQKQDARHFSVQDADIALPADATPGAEAIVYLVSAYPGTERDDSDAVAAKVRQILPDGVEPQLAATVDPAAKVNWTGGRPWDLVLAEAVKPLGVKLEATDKSAVLTR